MYLPGTRPKDGNHIAALMEWNSMQNAFVDCTGSGLSFQNEDSPHDLGRARGKILSHTTESHTCVWPNVRELVFCHFDPFTCHPEQGEGSRSHVSG